MTMETLDAKKFDAAVGTSRPIARVIWGCKAIGQAIGRSGDYVRDTFSKLPGTPVRRQGREYYARQDELDSFFRTPQ